ncbi:MAG: lipocalin family protein [Bacteroidia bacterium]
MNLNIMFILFGCNSIPSGIKAVDSFEKNKYLGKWYEIARFDFRFERNLNNTTAEYSLNDNGVIKVVNRGWNTVKMRWGTVEGKAKFVESENIAKLKVSFFGPFYAGYNVIELDKDYRFALVCGNSKDYLWILGRDKIIPDSIKTKYLIKANQLGFNTEKLLWIEHNLKE